MNKKKCLCLYIIILNENDKYCFRIRLKKERINQLEFDQVVSSLILLKQVSSLKFWILKHFSWKPHLLLSNILPETTTKLIKYDMTKRRFRSAAGLLESGWRPKNKKERIVLNWKFSL